MTKDDLEILEKLGFEIDWTKIRTKLSNGICIEITDDVPIELIPQVLFTLGIKYASDRLIDSILSKTRCEESDKRLVELRRYFTEIIKELDEP